MRYLGALFLTLTVTSFGAAEGGSQTTITYIANEGFLIEIGAKKILIDAIFDDQTIDYSHVPDEATLARMQKSEAPFDDIDVILVTHRHQDHFATGPVFQRLANDRSSVLVAPPQAVEKLKSVSPDLEGVSGRIREVDLELFGAADLEIAGIHIRAIRCRHSAYLVTDETTGTQYNRHEGVENLIYLIEVDGIRFLHVGDALLSQNLEFFEEKPFPGGKIDFVFLEFFDWSEDTKDILDRWMRPDHVVFMHLPPQQDKIEKIEQRLEGAFPNAVVFEEPLQVRRF